MQHGVAVWAYCGKVFGRHNDFTGGVQAGCGTQVVNLNEAFPNLAVTCEKVHAAHDAGWSFALLRGQRGETGVTVFAFALPAGAQGLFQPPLDTGGRINATWSFD